MTKIPREKLEEFRRQAAEKDSLARQEFELFHNKFIKSKNYLDEDGYPSSDALKLIELWHWSDPIGWFEFISNMWNLKSFGWHSIKGGEDEWLQEKLPSTTLRYYISTAGWSGNEQIIRVMEKNEELWYKTWVQSRRGGHYIFEIEEKEVKL